MMALVLLSVAQPIVTDALQAELQELADRSRPLRLHVVVHDVAKDRRLQIGSADPIYIASGVKLALLLAAAQMEADGALSMDERLVWRTRDRRSGSPVTSAWDDDARATVRRLLSLAIRHSDNGATDRLMDRVGIERVNAALARDGLVPFGPVTSMLDVRRHIFAGIDPRLSTLDAPTIFAVESLPTYEARARALGQRVGRTANRTDMIRAYRRYYAQGLNSARLAAMTDWWVALVRRRLVNAQASERMLALLLRTRTGADRFAAGLPSGVRWAHKTGTQYARISDFGVAWASSHRPVVLAGVVEGRTSRQHSERLLAKVAARISAAAGWPSREHRLEDERQDHQDQDRRDQGGWAHSLPDSQ